MTTATISLLVQGSPFHSNACEQALEFAKAIIRNGHQLFQVFFYKDAVLIANQSHTIPTDERNIQQDWIDFATTENIKLSVCVGACERRGIHSTLGANKGTVFDVVGLGQLTEAMFESDRLVTFH